MVGFVFLLFGSIVSLVTIPWRLPVQLRLLLPDAGVCAGRIERVEDPGTHYTDRSVAYHYAYTPTDGQRLAGRCYTSGPRWQAGDAVQVRFAPGRPAVACPQGARLDSEGPIGLLAVLFPAIGGGMFLGGLFRRHRAAWLLRHGVPLAVKVTSVEITRLRINGVPRFRIAYVPLDNGASSQIEKHTDSEVVDLARTRLRRKTPVFLLVDPRRPRRTLWIEALL